MRRARVLLVQMPFFRLESPSLGLELLAASLRRAGVQSEVAYLNLELSRRVGKRAYGWISSRAPRYLLLGDLVFAPGLHGEEIPPARLASLIAGLGRRRESGVPDWLVAGYPELVRSALDLLGEQGQAIARGGYDLVGIGTLFHVVPALALARAIKETPGAPPVILGGSNCEGEMGEQLHLSYPFVDYVCRGEGEELIVQLVGQLEGAQRGPAIPGLLWRDAGGETRGRRSSRATVGAEGGPARGGLDGLPLPRYHDWLERVRSLGVLGPDELRLPLETSRGCWYGERRHCVYCGFTGEAMTFRTKSPTRIVEEVSDLVQLGARFLHCVDNIPDPRSFEAVLPRLTALANECQLFWEVMPNLTCRQVELLRKSGVRWVQAGIESLSTRVLRLMGKGTSALQNVRFLKYAAQWGIGASWSLLFGFAGEDPSDYREMQALMPALAHLQPPYADHQQVRVDRFSPMFRARQGLKKVLPARAYHDALRLEPEAVARLAYYFDYEYVDQPDPYEYTRGCAEETRRWREATATAALVCFERGDALHLLDTRPVAAPGEAELRGIARQTFLAAEHGASLGEIAAGIGASPAAARAALAPLLDRRWIVELDGRYLSLAVPVDAWIPPGVPPVLVRDTLVAEYCRRMVHLRDGFYADDARPAHSSGGARR